ncbi:MAG: C39 family peptidase [Nanoarchaeota archaeon]|nr:C39 family peptidase [Nanoarchaeota archaeon]
MQKRGATVVNIVLTIGLLVVGVIVMSTFQKMMGWQTRETEVEMAEYFLGRITSAVEKSISFPTNAKYEVVSSFAEEYILTVSDNLISITFPERDITVEQTFFHPDINILPSVVENAGKVRVFTDNDNVLISNKLVCDPDDEVCDPGCAVERICDPLCYSDVSDGVCNPYCTDINTDYANNWDDVDGICDPDCSQENGICDPDCLGDIDCHEGNGVCEPMHYEDCSSGADCTCIAPEICCSKRAEFGSSGCVLSLNAEEGEECQCEGDCSSGLLCSNGHCCLEGTEWSSSEEKCIDMSPPGSNCGLTGDFVYMIEYAMKYVGCRYSLNNPQIYGPNNCNPVGLTCASYVQSVLSGASSIGSFPGSGCNMCTWGGNPGKVQMLGSNVDKLEPGDIFQAKTTNRPCIGTGQPNSHAGHTGFYVGKGILSNPVNYDLFGISHTCYRKFEFDSNGEHVFIHSIGNSDGGQPGVCYEYSDGLLKSGNYDDIQFCRIKKQYATDDPVECEEEVPLSDAECTYCGNAAFNNLGGWDEEASKKCKNSGLPCCHGKCPPNAKVLNVPYLNQCQPSLRYGMHGKSSDACNSMCGPTSVAMVLHYNGVKKSPLNFWERIKGPGAWYGWAVWFWMEPFLEENINKDFILTSSMDWNGVKKSIDKGEPIIFSIAMSSVPYFCYQSTSGHVLVAVGYAGNNYVILNDPYTSSAEAENYPYGYCSDWSFGHNLVVPKNVFLNIWNGRSKLYAK